MFNQLTVIVIIIGTVLIVHKYVIVKPPNTGGWVHSVWHVLKLSIHDGSNQLMHHAHNEM